MSDGGFKILNFSDEILVKIICYLNARERGSLGESCKKFHELTFGEKRLFRDLDFSEEGYLTSVNDVQKYFKNERMHKQMRIINLGGMFCSSPEPLLQDIKKAKHLVELNIIGMKFDNLQQIGSLLNLLVHLSKLSFGWPRFAKPSEGVILKKSLNRIKYLTVRVDNVDLVNSFFPVLLRYSKKLEELFLLVTHFGNSTFASTYLSEDLDALQLTCLPRLKIVAGYNIDYLYIPLHELFEQILPDRERWTEFRADSYGLLYYEKDLNVVPEMKSHVHDFPTGLEFAGLLKYLEPGTLLTDMVENASGITAEDFQCLRRHEFSVHPVMLKIKDVKLLLKNPNHQISYIHLDSDLEETCAAYLSAFPYLKELVLRGIIKSKAPSIPCNPAEMKEEIRNSEEPNGAVNSTPGFHKLVKNTPHLKNLALGPRCGYEANPKTKNDPWDLTAMELISGWKELTSLFLSNIPITNGTFLIEIGKQCENLEKLRLEDLGPRSDCCYKNDLSQMLPYCRNLKDFSINQDNLGQVSDVFTMFVATPKLRRLHIKSSGQNNTFDDLVSSVETLMLSHKVVLLVCDFEKLTEAAYDNLKSNLQKMKAESDHKTFEFQIINHWDMNGFPRPSRDSTLEYAHKDLLLSFSMINALYQLGC